MKELIKPTVLEASLASVEQYCEIVCSRGGEATTVNRGCECTRYTNNSIKLEDEDILF